MISLIPLFSKPESCARALIMGLLLTICTLMFEGGLQAQNPSETSHSEIAYFNDFKLIPEANEIHELSIGIDLVNGSQFNYTDSVSTATQQKETSSGSLNPYRTTVLIMGIAFVVVTFTQALIPLIKSASRAPIPAGVPPENQHCA
jgi:hypothetical protein